MCHCWASPSWDACHQLGLSPKRRPRTRCSIALVRGQKEDWSKDILGEHAFSKEGRILWRNCQNFMVHQDTLYLHSMPKGENEDLLLFIVPRAHQTAALNGCHWDAGHQGHDHTLSLLQECFWWPRMAQQMRQTIRACTSCLQYEGGLP